MHRLAARPRSWSTPPTRTCEEDVVARKTERPEISRFEVDGECPRCRSTPAEKAHAPAARVRRVRPLDRRRSRVRRCRVRHAAGRGRRHTLVPLRRLPGVDGDRPGKDGEIVSEKIAVRTGFGDADDFERKRKEFLDWLIDKRDEWGQEALGFEFVGDLRYP